MGAYNFISQVNPSPSSSTPAATSVAFDATVWFGENQVRRVAANLAQVYIGDNTASQDIVVPPAVLVPGAGHRSRSGHPVHPPHHSGGTCPPHNDQGGIVHIHHSKVVQWFWDKYSFSHKDLKRSSGIFHNAGDRWFWKNYQKKYPIIPDPF